MESVIDDLFGFLDLSEGLTFEALFVLIVFSLMLEIAALCFEAIGRVKK